MALKRFDSSKFTTPNAKPMPVILLLDVSGSMSEVINDSYEPTGQTVFRDGQQWEIVNGGITRIDVLNQAVQEMIASFAKEEQLGHEFLVSVVTFGGTVRVHLPPTKASQIEWQPLTAADETPLGEALTLVKQMLEDKTATPSRAYRPVVILVSDGRPTDAWEAPLAGLLENGRSMKCDRISLAIGPGTDEDMLRKFIAGTPNPLFHASNANQILETFRRVTMSVTIRSKSKDPNQVSPIASFESPPALDTSTSAAPPAASTLPDDGYW